MSKIRILATEDDPIHEAKLRMVMDSLKYDLIDVIVDPHQVIPIIRATNPDILLMDVDLDIVLFCCIIDCFFIGAELFNLLFE